MEVPMPLHNSKHQKHNPPRTQTNATSDNDRQQYTGKNRGANKKTTPREPRETREPKFEGKCEDMKGHVYNCTDGRQAGGYTKTTEEIAEHIGRTYRFGADASCVISTLGPPVWVKPSNPHIQYGEKKLSLREEDERVPERKPSLGVFIYLGTVHRCTML
jgi:hypothetical protein